MTSLSKEVSKKEWLFLIGIFIFSTTIRMIALIITHPHLKGDENGYLSLAQSIISGNGFSINGTFTSLYSPLYPYFLSSILTLTEDLFYIRAAQTILGGIICFPLYFLTRYLFNIQIAILSSFIFSIYLSLVYSSFRLLTETLFTLLFICFMYLFICGKKSKTFFGAGVCLGLATLTRPLSLYLPLILIPLILKFKNYKQFWILPAMMLTILPWTIRNYIVHHHLVLISTKQGYVLYNSSHPVKGKIFGLETPKDDVIKQSQTIDSEVERNRFLSYEGYKYIQKHPLQYIRLAIIKILFFWIPFDWEIISNDGKAIYNFLYAFIFPLFLISIFYALFQKKILHHQQQIILITIVYFCLFCIITYGSPRFRIPIEPYIILFSSFGMYQLYKKFSKKIFYIGISLFFILNFHIYKNTDLYKTILAKPFSSIGLW